MNREPDLVKLMLWVYGDNEWLYPDSAPQPLSGGRPPPNQMKRVTVQNLKMQLGGHGQAPGYAGNTAGSGAGGSGIGARISERMGSIAGAQNAAALKGQLTSKMNQLKGFAKGMFK
jgi:hypothetical protein